MSHTQDDVGYQNGDLEDAPMNDADDAEHDEEVLPASVGQSKQRHNESGDEEGDEEDEDEDDDDEDDEEEEELSGKKGKKRAKVC